MIIFQVQDGNHNYVFRGSYNISQQAAVLLRDNPDFLFDCEVESVTDNGRPWEYDETVPTKTEKKLFSVYLASYLTEPAGRESHYSNICYEVMAWKRTFMSNPCHWWNKYGVPVYIVDEVGRKTDAPICIDREDGVVWYPMQDGTLAQFHLKNNVFVGYSLCTGLDKIRQSKENGKLECYSEELERYLKQ